jgi:hypothetical protein
VISRAPLTWQLHEQAFCQKIKCLEWVERSYTRPEKPLPILTFFRKQPPQVNKPKPEDPAGSCGDESLDGDDFVNRWSFDGVIEAVARTWEMI